MPVKSNTLPIHSLPGNASAVQVRRIEHKNPYDFTREHRHTYFEVFFFEKGGGSQLIDFVELPVREKSCYIVFPQQIHLLKRAPGACGRLVQFGEELITSTTLRMMLQRHFFNDNQAVFFEQDAARFSKFGILLGMLEETSDKTTAVSKETGWHYLQAMLLQLLEGKEPDQPGPASLSGDKKLLFAFQQMLEGQFRENHQVARYANELATTERKLASLTQRFLGLSPLQVIHNRLLLEAKRLLLFEATSHKEIAFDLGFDSPASFSLFIKNKTGFSPSELNRQLVDFHKITEH